MDFALTYRGELPAARNHDQRSEDKHRIRKELHLQLAQMWERDSRLRQGKILMGRATLKNRQAVLSSGYENYAHWRAESCGYLVQPIVTRHNGLVCELDVEFLRPHEPGDLLHGGDLDNRLKVLFDALHIPLDNNEVPGHMHGQNEELLYCLLEDDSLISSLSIKTHLLLSAPPSGLANPDAYVELLLKGRIYSLRPHMMTQTYSA